MNDPERIYLQPNEDPLCGRKWNDERIFQPGDLGPTCPGDTEYIRADLYTKLQQLDHISQHLLDAASDIKAQTPDKNCSCHISSPCLDCDMYGWIRDLHNSLIQCSKDIKDIYKP